MSPLTAGLTQPAALNGDATDVLSVARMQAGIDDQSIPALSLDAFQRGVPDLPIAPSLVSAKVTLTIEGASTLELGISDPEWLVEASGVLDPDGDGRMQAVDVTLNTLQWRLVKASRVGDPDVLVLTFEPLAVTALRSKTKPKTWSRNSYTRAQAIQAMVTEVASPQLAYDSPERDRKQVQATPDYPSAAPAVGDTGFDKGVKLKVKTDTADAAQLREMATVLTVCDQLNVTPRARLAAVVAAIGESQFRAVMNSKGSNYGGVFQGDVKGGVWKLHDTEGMARAFLKGGKGFNGGGAITLARQHPDWTVGHIAFTVEGNISNFGGDQAKAANFYDQWHDQGAKIVAAWNGANGSTNGTHDVLSFKSYQFTRGLPGQRESSWTAMQRLAGEVHWRCFEVGGVITFASDDFLISRRAIVVLDGPDADGLLERPGYDWDHGKVAGEVDLTLDADAYSIAPGDVVSLQHMGPVSGRWLSHTVEQDLFDSTQTAVHCTKPMAAAKEPAPQVVTRTVDSSGDSVSGAAGSKAAIAWAKSRIGHYKEDLGFNRGQELDQLESKFGMVGQPWCAIFATTAVAQGGVTRDCRTASVASIRAWCAAGSNGYQKGFRTSPEPGDLMCFGTQHVILITKVNRADRSCEAIQGNGAAGQVDTRSVLWSAGEFVRPKYPD